MDRERVLELIYDTIDLVNRQLPPAKRLARSPATIIVGTGGSLDSLGIVNFVVALEEKAGDAIGRPLRLLDAELISTENGPFHSVDSLSKHVAAVATAAR
jgi:acyl carrier protein